MEKITAEMIVDLNIEGTTRVAYWKDLDNGDRELRYVSDWQLYKDCPVDEIIHDPDCITIVVYDVARARANEVFKDLPATDREWERIKRFLPNDNPTDAELWKARYQHVLNYIH